MSKLSVAMTLMLMGSVPSYTQQERDTSWLIHIPTAHTLGKGQSEVYLFGSYTEYRIPDARTTVTDLIFNGHVGVTQNLSASVTLPVNWMRDLPVRQFGVRDVKFLLSYRFMKSSKLDIAAQPSISFPTGKIEDLRGTGRLTYGLHFLFSWRRAVTSLHTKIGVRYDTYVFSDVKHYSDGRIKDILGRVSWEQVWAAAVGVEQKLLPSLSLVFEGVLESIPGHSDQDFFLYVGNIVHLRDSLQIKASAGLGVPRDRRNTLEYKTAFGLSYLLN